MSQEELRYNSLEDGDSDLSFEKRILNNLDDVLNTETDDSASLLLTETNALLESMKFGSKTTFTNIQDLEKSASSMFVALYEKLFDTRLDGIIRTPTTASDYITNAQEVLEALSTSVLNAPADLDEITGASLVSGDIPSLRYMVKLFRTIYKSTKKQKSPRQKLNRATSSSISSSGGTASPGTIKQRKAKVSVAPLNKSKKKKDTTTDSSIDFGNLSRVSSVSSNSKQQKTQKKNVSKKKERPTTSATKKPQKKEGTKKTRPPPPPPVSPSRNDPSSIKYKQALKEHLQELRSREASCRKRVEREMNGRKYRQHLEKIRSLRLHHDMRMQKVSLGMQRKAQEEANLKNVMEYMVSLEHSRLREEQRNTDLMLERIASKHALKEKAMENFYNDQIQMIREQAKEESRDRALMEKANRDASNMLLREIRVERERQMKDLLDQREHLMEAEMVNAERSFKHLRQKKEGSSHKSRRGGSGIMHAAALHARSMKKERERQLAAVYGRSSATA